MRELKNDMNNITNHIAAIHANYTALEQSLHNYENKTNGTVYTALTQLQAQVMLTNRVLETQGTWPVCTMTWPLPVAMHI